MMHTRAIPSSGELLPVVGLGTWQTFDVPTDSPRREPLSEVLRTMVSQGATVVDSSPMYGRSETVVGELSEALKVNDRIFAATKVWTTGKAEGIRQMEQSMRFFRRSQIDLMQIHNLVDWQTHLSTLRGWKKEGRVRYLGFTHYRSSQHRELAELIRSHPVDFVQINYNIFDRAAEKELFPAARECGVAVLINLPFGEGKLFQKVRSQELPPWAASLGITTWGVFFLKFILSHPAVTCVIPATANPAHLSQNLEAGTGPLPSAAEREKMIEWVGA